MNATVPEIVRVTDGDIEPTSLEDAVAISLFSSRRANGEHGWWADPEMGSLIWQSAQAKIVPSTLRAVEDAASEALAWMVESGMASAVDVVAERQGRLLALGITITRPDGTTSVVRFDDLWETL